MKWPIGRFGPLQLEHEAVGLGKEEDGARRANKGSSHSKQARSRMFPFERAGSKLGSKASETAGPNKGP